MFTKTHKYDELVGLYTDMANNGYERVDGQSVTPDHVFSHVQVTGYREPVKDILSHFKCRTALDYGAGGGHWDQVDVPEGGSLKSYLGLETVNRFEPARGVDGKIKSDVVICFDVLEHIFLADVPYVVDELFRLANQLIIVNVACYSAAAMLPNGENAHISVRPAGWWTGVFDTIGTLYPDIAYVLFTSDEYNKAVYHGTQRVREVIEKDGYTR